MQLERFEEAMAAFSRVLSINDEAFGCKSRPKELQEVAQDGQAWANLAAVHLQQERVGSLSLLFDLGLSPLGFSSMEMAWEVAGMR